MQAFLLEVARTVFLATETYNFLAHFIIFAGIRMVPRKDLVRSWLYFVQDTGSVTMTTLLFVPYRFWWISALQFIQHFGLVVAWDKTKPCKQVITWSSLESYKINDGKRWSTFLWDSYLGTLFDIGVHLWLSIHMLQTASVLQMALAVLMNIATFRTTMFNPRRSWARPGAEPEWVKKRMATDIKYD
uniref:Uncharacterized protein n=1 Tax=Plectus sambesii TaxID=2011161 RepID=A0A914XQV9_9BILA